MAGRAAPTAIAPSGERRCRFRRLAEMAQSSAPAASDRLAPARDAGQAGSAAAPTARCRNRRRGSFITPSLVYGRRSTSRHHSGLMLAARITLAHFSVSAATKLPKSEGEPAITVPPRSASRALSWGSARAALISLLSLLTISAGVPEGPPTPYQPLELVARHELVHRRHVRQSF